MPIKVGSEEWNILLQQLNNNDPSLTALKLNFNDIGNEGVKALCEALENNSAVISLELKGELGGEPMEQESVKALSQVLEKNKALTAIDLYFNQIGAEGVRILSLGLMKNETLHSLKLSSNQMSDEGAKIVAELLESNTSLTSLDLSRNQIGVEGAKHLGRALEKNRSLSDLSISYNDIGAEGSQFLGQALEKNSTLSELAFSDNLIGVVGMQIFCQVLKENRALKSLGLSNNQFGAEGMQLLSEALKKNQTLNYLSLGSNQIGDKGIQALRSGLENNSGLTSLLLSDNQISNQGAQILIQILQKNYALNFIDLGSATSKSNTNKVEQKERQQIIDLLKSSLRVEQAASSSSSKEEKTIQTISIPELCKKIQENKLEKLDLAGIMVPDYWSPEVSFFVSQFNQNNDYSDTTVFKIMPSDVPIRATSKGIIYVGYNDIIYVPGKTSVKALMILSSRFIASSTKGLIHIWDLKNLKSSGFSGNTKCVKEINLSTSNEILAMEMLDNSQVVSLMSSGVLQFLDVWSGKCTSYIQSPFLPSFYCKSAIKIRDSKAFVVGVRDQKKHIIGIFDIQQRKQIANLEGHEDYITAIEFLPGNKLASSDSKGVVKIWQLNDFKCIQTLTHDNGISSLAVLPSGELVVGTSSGLTAQYSVPQYQTVATEIHVHRHAGHAQYTAKETKYDRVYTGNKTEIRKENAPAITIWNLYTLENKTHVFDKAGREALTNLGERAKLSISDMEVFSNRTLKCYVKGCDYELNMSCASKKRFLQSKELQMPLAELQNNCSVTELNLREIQLDASRDMMNMGNLQALIEMIKFNNSLKKINMTHATIDSVGLAGILEALEKNSYLVEIKFDLNKILKNDQYILEKMQQHLDKNKISQTITVSQSNFFKNQHQVIKSKALTIIEKSISEYEQTAETKKSTHLGRAFSIFCFHLHLKNIKIDTKKSANDIDKLIDIAIQNMIDQKEFGSRGYQKSSFYQNLITARSELKMLLQTQQDLNEDKKETSEIFSA